MSSDFPRLSWTGLKSLDLPPGKEHSRRWHRADLRSLLKSPRTHGGLSLPPSAWNRLPRAAPGPQPPHLLEGFVVEKHFFPQTPPLGRVLRARPRTPKRGFPVARGPYVPAERNSPRQEINDLSLPCPLGPEPCGRTAVLRKHSFGDALSSAQRISQPIGAPVNLPFPPMHFFYCYYYFLQHMEILRLGVKLELQLLAYTTATARLDPSIVGNLLHSSQQCQFPDPLSEAGDQTHILMDTG